MRRLLFILLLAVGTLLTAQPPWDGETAPGPGVTNPNGMSVTAVITYDGNHVPDVADRLAVYYNSNYIGEGTVIDLTGQPSYPYEVYYTFTLYGPATPLTMDFIVYRASDGTLYEAETKLNYQHPGTAGSFGAFGLDPPVVVDVDTEAGVLPVSLGRFSVVRSAKSVALRWETLTETGTRNFSVQRSIDGSNFTSLADLPARGSTAYPNLYEYTDRSVDPDRDYYYRLRMTDEDGTFEYSPLRYVAANASQEMVVFPNPVAVGQRLRVSGSMLDIGPGLLLLDAMGRHHAIAPRREAESSDNPTVSWSVPNLSPGTYYLLSPTGRTARLFITR